MAIQGVSFREADGDLLDRAKARARSLGMDFSEYVRYLLEIDMGMQTGPISKIDRLVQSTRYPVRPAPAQPLNDGPSSTPPASTAAATANAMMDLAVSEAPGPAPGAAAPISRTAEPAKEVSKGRKKKPRPPTAGP